MSPHKKPRKPVALYVRVSQTAGRAGESFQSPAEQEERARAAVVATGLAPGDVYTDLDQSGGRMSRPEFDRLKADIESGQIGGVAVSRLDRLGRTTRGVIDFVEECESRRAVVIAARESLDTTTSTGRFVLSIFAALAQLELERYQEQWASVRAGARARGVHLSPVPPVGYDRLEGGQIKPNGDADAIRWAFEARAAGMSCSEIAREMTHRGVLLRLPNGKGEDTRWTDSTVRHMIANGVYKMRTGDPRTGGETYDPIVPASLHRRANSQTTRTRRRPDESAEERERRTTLLSGICVCGSCGRPLTNDSQVYRCFQRGKDAEPCPRPVSIRRAGLEPFVEEEAFLRADRRVQEEILSGTAGGAAEPDLSGLEAAVADAESQLAEYLKRPSPRAVAIEALEDAADAARETLDEARHARPFITPEDYDRLTSASFRRTLIANEVERVVVRPGGNRYANPGERVEIVYRAA